MGYFICAGWVWIKLLLLQIKPIGWCVFTLAESGNSFSAGMYQSHLCLQEKQRQVYSKLTKNKVFNTCGAAHQSGLLTQSGHLTAQAVCSRLAVGALTASRAQPWFADRASSQIELCQVDIRVALSKKKKQNTVKCCSVESQTVKLQPKPQSVPPPSALLQGRLLAAFRTWEQQHSTALSRNRAAAYSNIKSNICCIQYLWI